MNSERLRKFQNRSLPLRSKDKELFSALIARLCVIVNSEIDEDETGEIIDDFIKDEKINVESVHRLALLIRTTRLNESVSTVH